MSDSEQTNIAKIERKIDEQLQAQSKKIVNRNALNALFAAFGDKSAALGQIFLGRHDALIDEHHKIEQTAILNLLCKIDNAITETENDLKK